MIRYQLKLHFDIEMKMKDGILIIIAINFWLLAEKLRSLELLILQTMFLA